MSIMANSKGFSLIELMVVIAIVAILAAVAIPSYKSYITRSKLAEVWRILEVEKNRYGSAVATGADPAFTNTDVGEYLTSIETNANGNEGQIIVTFRSTAVTGLPFAGTITYGLLGNQGDVNVWGCTGTSDSNILDYIECST